MKRTAGISMLLAALSGCLSANPGEGHNANGGPQHHTTCGHHPHVPGVQGPWGQPVPMAAPYTSNPPSGKDLALQMMGQSVPLGMVQPHPNDQGIQLASAQQGPGAGSGLIQASHVAPPGMSGPNMITPPGVPANPGMPGGMGAGMPGMPGMPPMGGMAQGMPDMLQQVGHRPPGAVAALGAAAFQPPRFPTQRTEVRFVGPAGMKISWYGVGGFGSNTIEAPGRYNFAQGAIYRLKLTDLPNRPGVDLYPTLEVVPSNLKTDAFLAHSAVPVFFTDEDFEQVANGNYLVKVIYLPYPQYADAAITGPDEVVSTRLEPGADPIQEAIKRGSILLVIRLGNIDLEAPNTPPMDAPNPYLCRPRADGPGMPGPAMAGVGGAMGMPPMAGMMPPMGGMMMPGPGMPMVPGPGMQGVPARMTGQPVPAGPPPAIPAKNPPVLPVEKTDKPITFLPGAIQPVGHQEQAPATPASLAGKR